MKGTRPLNNTEIRHVSACFPGAFAVRNRGLFWHHIAGVKEGDKFIFYIDGEVVDEQTVPVSHAQGAEELYIGKTGFASKLFYINDLFGYDRALSPGEIEIFMEGVSAARSFRL